MNTQNKMNESLRNVELASQEYVALMKCMVENKIWVMRSAQKTLKISDMTTIHIENALYVAKRALRHDFESDVRREYYQRIIPCLESELDLRYQYNEDDEENFHEPVMAGDPMYSYKQDECTCENDEHFDTDNLGCQCKQEFIEKETSKRKKHNPIYFHSPILEVLTEIEPAISYEDVVKRMHEKLENRTKVFQNLDKLENDDIFSNDENKEKTKANTKSKKSEKNEGETIEKTLTIDLTKDSPEDVARKIASIFEEVEKIEEKNNKTDKGNENHDFIESVLDNVIGRLL